MSPGLKDRQRPRLPAVTFNAWIGQDATDDRDPDDLRDNLRRMMSDASDALGEKIAAACLQEVWDWEGSIPGYQPVRTPRGMFGPEGRSTQWLLLDDLDYRAGFRQAPGEWIWNGNRKAPRVFPRVSFQHAGKTWDLTGIHRVPNGPKPQIDMNRAAWNAEHSLIEQWQTNIQERRPKHLRALFGDWNAGADEDPGYPYSIARLAKEIGCQTAMRHIDGALVDQRLEVRELQRLEGKYGSDGHRPVIMTLVA